MMHEQTAWKDHLTDIGAIIHALPWSEQAFMYLERVPLTLLDERERRDGVRLERYRSDVVFEEWQRGRVFDAQQELKWEWNPGDSTFHLVSCGACIPEGLTPYSLDVDRVDEVCYYTWGQRIEGADESVFVEAQIPRLLHYPVGERALRVQVCVKALYAPDGQLCYARWCGLREETTP